MGKGKRIQGWVNDYWRYFIVKGKKTRLFSFRNWVWKSRQKAIEHLAILNKTPSFGTVNHYRITKEKFGYRLWVI